jgi:hypothetical protein
LETTPSWWIDSNFSGNTLVSGKTSQIFDRSGNGNHAVQSTDSRRPTQVTLANGAKSNLFNGTTATGTFMNLTNPLVFSGEFTLIAFITPSGDANTRCILGETGTNVKFGKYLTNKLIARVAVGDDNDITVDYGMITANNLQVQHYYRDESLVGSYDFQFRKNPATLGSETGTTGFNVIGMGETTTEYHLGHIHEMIAWDRALTTEEIDNIAVYGITKWFGNYAVDVNGNPTYNNTTDWRFVASVL